LAKITSRGTVWRARQVLSNLGKRKRRHSEDTGISTSVQLAADHDVPALSDSRSETELLSSKTLFSLPNVPIGSTPRVQVRPSLVPSLSRRSTHDTLPSAPTSPQLASPPFESVFTPAAPGAPWAPPSLSLALTARVVFFLPWCFVVGAAIALYPRALSPLVRMYAEPPRSPLHRLAHHAHTAHAHVGIFVGVLCLVAGALPSWPLRVALVGAVAVRAVVIWRGFEAQVEEHGEESEEGWRADARCVWRVLRGEEEREILRAWGVGGVAKDE